MRTIDIGPFYLTYARDDYSPLVVPAASIETDPPHRKGAGRALRIVGQHRLVFGRWGEAWDLDWTAEDIGERTADDQVEAVPEVS